MGRPTSRKVTVRDVALAAEVSPATASRALAGHPSVNAELVRRVLKASKDLGYSANVFARALRTQRTDTIGMVVPSITNPYFVAAVEAVEQVLAESDRSLILCDSHDTVATEAARIDLLVNRMVDGLIVIPVSADDSVPALRAAAAEVALTQFDRIAESAGTDFVGGDNVDGVRQCIEHLRDRGCRTFAYIGARPTTSTATERLRAFRLFAAEGAAVDRSLLLGEFTAEWGRQAATSLLADGPLPDAVVCGADVIAVSLLTALRAARVEVPGDVKVVSYDDSDMVLLTVPRLTSVHQPVDAMAREAVRLLDQRREDGGRPVVKSIFPPTIVVRESTGA
jgi:LacI family transcriptional regulator